MNVVLVLKTPTDTMEGESVDRNCPLGAATLRGKNFKGMAISTRMWRSLFLSRVTRFPSMISDASCGKSALIYARIDCGVQENILECFFTMGDEQRVISLLQDCSEQNTK